MLQRVKRRAARLAIAGGLATAVVGGALALTSGVASASGGCGSEPSDNNLYINCALPAATPPPYTTYSDGQQINLSVGPNSIFSPTDGLGGSVVAIECEYNNGTGGLGDPPNANFCDAGTAPGDFPLTVNSDGSFDYTAQTGDMANAWAVPGRSFAGASITCDPTHPCVWYFGENYNDFNQPHIFSNPFEMLVPPIVSSGNATTFIENTAGSFHVTASSNPASTFAETGRLPSGVTLSSSGLLSGTPAIGSSGSYPITITASNGGTPNGTQAFTLTVIALKIDTQESAITTATQGAVYGPITFTATGGNTSKPYKWKLVGHLPKGLKLKNGVLAGTPSTKAAPGTYSFSVEVSTKTYKVPGTKPAVKIPGATVTGSFSITLVS